MTSRLGISNSKLGDCFRYESPTKIWMAYCRLSILESEMSAKVK